jgi:excisionase family DNA binding protein
MSELPESVRGIAEAFADLVATRVASKIGAPNPPSPWMTAAAAADYLGCSVSRIRTLTLTGELPHHRDGRRPMYHRDELDHYIRSGGASCP